MHNVLARVQNVFGFFTTVASVVAIVIAVLSLVTTPTPTLKDGSLVLKNVQVVKGRPHYYSQKKEEYAHVKFDLDVDLSSLFTWNTKQVFLYITASYPSSSTSTSKTTTPPTRSIIWDAILPHPLAPAHHNQYTAHRQSTTTSKARKTPTDARPGILQLSSQRPKYQITDVSGLLAGRANATLEMNWNVQPWVGALTWGSAAGDVGAGGPGMAWWRRALVGLSWRGIAGKGARSGAFDMPALKDRKEAGGAQALGTDKGGEANRGKPA